ncbi:sterol desaturase family protein [Pseudoteredinibacter isoporae]|uniref:sterol desaturase family protein n=1 Tax=Pseudoteredinibacter isoporae TaxID=570281 RepID=UPI00310B80DF
MQRIMPYIAFPLVLSGGLVACYLLFTPLENPALAPFVVMIAWTIPWMIWLEWWTPYRNVWSESHQDVMTDVIYLFLIQSLWPRLLTAFWMTALASATIWCSENLQFFSGQSWPHQWPLALQLVLALLLAEFGRYWVHRWAHELSFLWRFHAVHHSVERLYWLNAARFHPLEKILLHIPETLPFILLGANAEVLALYFVTTGIHGLFQHSNIQLKLGPLNYVFAMAELHRFHHSKVIRESNSNYGNNLIVWDLVFGTFYWPKDREVGDIGLLNPEYPKTFLRQCSAPFHKGKLDKPADYATNPEKYQQS